VDRHERRHLDAGHRVPGGPAHDVLVAPGRREPVEGVVQGELRPDCNISGVRLVF
jgi:hypothetical protein